MKINEIWPWIKAKAFWVLSNWLTILLVFVALMILVWFLVKLWRDIIGKET